MYHQRVKIFVFLAAVMLALCVVRLARMQLDPDPTLAEKIEQLKIQQSKTLKTARGRILDRNGNVLARDIPGFEIHIAYELSSFADERVQKAKLISASRRERSPEKIAKIKKDIQSQRDHLERLVHRIAFFGSDPCEITARIDNINNRIWNLRRHLAWKRKYPDFNDFELAVPDPNERLVLAANVDVAEMHQHYHLLDLQNEDDLFNAQVEFANVNGIFIVPRNHRIYPFADAACQLIGWVRPQDQTELFSDDPRSRYIEGDLAGYKGVEYVCEAILRGKRGREVYNIDKQLIDRTETDIGNDVRLSIDAELQSLIQRYLADCNSNANCDAPSAVVVIDVASGDVLAMVSMPVFDLNRIRYDYAEIASDPNRPLQNRVIDSHYPPGSVAKPLILVAGLEDNKITAGEVIECPAEKAPLYWPSCWIFNQYRTGHSLAWANNARNAIRGSCNIYFSRLANRLEPRAFQQWLYNFGYGHLLNLETKQMHHEPLNRNFDQIPGYISSTIPESTPESFEDVPPLKKSDLRWFGIGQGNFRVTPLQVANAIAVIARRGLYKEPRLIIPPDGSASRSVSLDISPHTLETVYDGMKAVVNEYGGTAYTEFKPMLDYFDLADVTVYGKTGSTQAPEHAWFGGFANDSTGRAVSIAVIVEGGQHGSSDAAPLARDIIQMCINTGHIGQPVDYIE